MRGDHVPIKTMLLVTVGIAASLVLPIHSIGADNPHLHGGYLPSDIHVGVVRKIISKERFATSEMDRGTCGAANAVTAVGGRRRRMIR
jgi:hypothetical protein